MSRDRLGRNEGRPAVESQTRTIPLGTTRSPVKTAFPVLLLLFAWITPPMLLLGGIRLRAGTGSPGLLLHILMLLVALTLVFLPWISGMDKDSGKPRRSVLLALVLGLIHGTLLVVYAFILITYRSIGILPNAEALHIALAQAATTLSIFGLSPAGLLGITLLLWAGLIWLYYRASRSLLAALGWLDSCVRINRAGSLSVLRIGALLVLLCAGVGYLVTYRFWLMYEPIHLLAGRDTDNFSQHNMVPPGILKTLLQRAKLRAADGPHVVAPRPRNLILITVDALRSDQMGAYGSSFDDTPFLSSLVERGELRRIDNAYSTCTYSFCGVLGIQTSSYWHQLPSASRPLADVLEHYGYRTHFLLAGDDSHFFGLQHFYASNPSEFRDGSSFIGAQVGDDYAILPWIEAVRWPKDQPTFLAVHLMSVHFTGLHHGEFARWQPSTIGFQEMIKGSVPAQIYANRYRNGILQADDMLRQIFDVLARRGVLRDALVVITADHGESLGEKGVYAHGHQPREPEVRIPLLVYDQSKADPGAAALYPARDLASQVDIAPTFLYAIGAPLPPSWAGTPLQISTTREVINIGTHETNGIVAQTAGGRFKYYRLVSSKEECLYALDTDPLELTNLAKVASAASILEEMRTDYRQSGQP